MAYSSSADIELQLSETELVELTDDAGAGSVDSDVITRAVADADALIDGYLGAVVTLPLTSTPSIIRTFSVDIAIYNLYSRRHDSVPDTRKDRYNNAIRFLEKVAEGKITLGSDDPSGSASDSGISYSGNDQVFTSDVMDRF